MWHDSWHWLLVAAFCIGVSKAGFSGVSLISVFLLAEVFGAKASLGIALPLLIVADLTVYPAFRKYGNWKEVWVILWPAIIGGAVAYWILSGAEDGIVRPLIGGVILLMVVLQLLKKGYPEKVLSLGKSRGFGVFAGLSGGVATVLANAAGPIQQMYLLTKGFEKMELIGVGARFFLVVNLLKLPFMAQLDLMDVDSLILSATGIPFLVLGVFVGKCLLKKVPQSIFEILIILFASVASVRLLLF